MSAFIVSDGTMDRAVSCILKLRERNQYFGELPTHTSDAGDVIGRALYALNDAAVCQRYQEPVGASSRYRWVPTGYKRPVEWLKAIQCLIYQCAEGDVPERPLFKELRKIEREMMSQIISQLPDYRNAPWDIDRTDTRNVTAA